MYNAEYKKNSLRESILMKAISPACYIYVHSVPWVDIVAFFLHTKGEGYA